MLYSRYYAPGTPPTTQEDQAKALAERVIPEPTTQEDQLRAAGYALPLDVEQPQTEDTSKDTEETSNSTEQSGESSGEVSEAIENRIAELVAGSTIPELREMAKQYGLDIPSRIKEENLARLIATHEQS